MSKTTDDVLHFKTLRYALLISRLKYHWHIDTEKFESELSNLAQQFSRKNESDSGNELFVNELYEYIFHLASAAGINRLGRDTEGKTRDYFFSSEETGISCLFLKRLFIKHALRSFCVLNTLRAITSTPPYSHETISFSPKSIHVLYSGAFVLHAVCQPPKKFSTFLEPSKSKTKPHDFSKRRYHLTKENASEKKIPIRKTAAQQMADITSFPFSLAITDSYWMAFLLHNNLRSVSQFERSLSKFSGGQDDSPSQITNILKDLIGIENSFYDIPPGALLALKNTDCISQSRFEEYKACDFLLNHMRLEQTFRVRYYLDILAMLHSKNPEKLYCRVPGCSRKEDSADDYRPCRRRLENLPDAELMKFFTYLDIMPNIFSRTLFLSYALDCYYLLRNIDHNYTAEPASASSILNLRHVNSYRSSDWTDLILNFLIYVNRELIPVLSDLWQAAADYLDCCPSAGTESCGSFSDILTAYAAGCRDDLTLDFASLSPQTVNDLASEISHAACDTGISASWGYFQKMLIPEIRKILTDPGHTASDISGLSRLKDTVLHYDNKKNRFSEKKPVKNRFFKNDLKKVGQLIKRTQKINSCSKTDCGKTENLFSDMLQLKNTLYGKDSFYRAEDTNGITPENEYRAFSLYNLSAYHFKSEHEQFCSEDSVNSSEPGN